MGIWQRTTCSTRQICTYGMGEGKSKVTPHWTYKKKRFKTKGGWQTKWVRSIAVFDNPDYDLKKIGKENIMQFIKGIMEVIGMQTQGTIQKVK